MKRRVWILFLAALMLFVLACKPAAKPESQDAPEAEAPVVTEAPVEAPVQTEAPAEPTAEPEPEPEPDNSIVILFTNDMHCGVEDGMGFEGVARIKTALENAGKNVLLVDAGDAVQGGIIGTLSKGEAIVELMNALGYDVATIGNHEFDYGMEQFNKNVSLAQFKYVACNFIDQEGNTVLDPYTIIECAGKKIAFVGVATPQTFKSSTPTFFMDESGKFIYSFCEGNNGQDLYDTVQKAVDAARAEGADYVIALTHLGVEGDCRPWTAGDVIEHTTGINAFIDGHSHTKENNLVKNLDGEEVLHVQTVTKLENLGMLTINPEGKFSAKMINFTTMELMDDLGLLAEDNGASDMIAAKLAENEELINKVVAHTDVDLIINDPVLLDVCIIRNQETNLGDLCADAYRAMGETDIAFVNGGGIRAKIPAGDITFGQIISVHPFGNSLCVAEVTGQQILDALEFGVSKLPGEFGGFLHVSGLKFVVDMKVESPVKTDEKGMFVSVEGDRRVKDVEVLQADGSYAPIDPEKIYTLACHDYYLKNRGDGYTMFAGCNLLRDSVMIDNQVLINYIVDVLNGTVGSEYADPYGQGRITFAE
ncbi:MAG: bifunctional metallophosphatase/5'-nucleotidase [Clostridia bacterium]|nr:bifunctional metallophosphatase/5'-nucleotidase [Clostridia bacterium]